METMKRKVYFSNTSLNEAINIYFDKINQNGFVLEKETIFTKDSLGRITCDAIFAAISSPNFNASAMDGIAVKSSSTFGATLTEHKFLHSDKDFIYVDTGDPIPNQYDSVIMIENIITLNEEIVEITSPAVPWQNIRTIGEDIIEGELILSCFSKIRPIDVGALLAGGILEVEVFKKPKIAIIPTGSELVEPSDHVQEGKLVEFNSNIFDGMIKEWGGESYIYNIVKDDFKKIKEILIDASEKYDIVLINAGSSAGTEDFTMPAIEELGEVVVHGLTIKPGKPAILGFINNKPVIGIPGYPVSAYIIMEHFVKPLINNINNQDTLGYPQVEATLSTKIVSSLKNQEFIRVKLGKIGEKFIATPLNRGAGVVMSLVRADGILTIPQNCEGLQVQSNVKVDLLKNIKEIENGIVCIGSHDPMLDVLTTKLHEKHPGIFLSCSHVGSMGGIISLSKEETHFSTIHLLDESTGVYNQSYIEKHLKDKDIVLFKFLKRVQGIMTKKGNPKDIKSFEDLIKDDVKYVNRQRGAGTRILLDYWLKKLGISPSEINGYEHEENTHLGVAVAIDQGNSDCGLGVYSAAKVFGLEFIPICDEDYDIAIPRKYMEQENIKKMFEYIKSEEFIAEIKKLGGYKINY